MPRRLVDPSDPSVGQRHPVDEAVVEGCPDTCPLSTSRQVDYRNPVPIASWRTHGIGHHGAIERHRTDVKRQPDACSSRRLGRRRLPAGLAGPRRGILVWRITELTTHGERQSHQGDRNGMPHATRRPYEVQLVANFSCSIALQTEVNQTRRQGAAALSPTCGASCVVRRIPTGRPAVSTQSFAARQEDVTEKRADHMPRVSAEPGQSRYHATQRWRLCLAVSK